MCAAQLQLNWTVRKMHTAQLDLAWFEQRKLWAVHRMVSKATGGQDDLTSCLAALGCHWMVIDCWVVNEWRLLTDYQSLTECHALTDAQVLLVCGLQTD